MSDEEARVLAALRRIGGGVAVRELAFKTGLSETAVLEALWDLETQGLVRPWAWCTAPQEETA